MSDLVNRVRIRCFQTCERFAYNMRTVRISEYEPFASFTIEVYEKRECERTNSFQCIRA